MITLENQREWKKKKPCFSFPEKLELQKSIVLVWKTWPLSLTEENHYNKAIWFEWHCISSTDCLSTLLPCTFLTSTQASQPCNYLPFISSAASSLVSSSSSFFSLPSRALRASCEIRYKISQFCKVSKWHLSGRGARCFCGNRGWDSRRCDAASSNSVHPNRSNVSF